MPLVWIVLLILAFFGLYSIAPIFGLDELYPGVLGEEGAFGKGILIALMLIGGVFFMVGRNRRRNDDRD